MDLKPQNCVSPHRTTFFARYGWSSASGFITIFHISALYITGHYLYKKNILPQDWPWFATVGRLHVLATAAAVFLGVMALIRERPPIYGAIATIAGPISFFFYVG